MEIHYLFHILILGFFALFYYATGKIYSGMTVFENHQAKIPQKNEGDDVFANIKNAALDGGPDSLKFLEECLQNEDDQIAILASKSLSEIGTKEAMNILYDHILKLDTQIRSSPRKTELKSKNLMTQEELKSSPTWKNLIHPKIAENDFLVLEAYRSGPDKDVQKELDVRIFALASDVRASHANRYYALLSLRGLEDFPLKKLVQDCLFSREPLLKMGAMELISWFGWSEFIKKLELELFSPHPSVVVQALWALCELNSKESMRVMKLLENHREGIVRDALQSVMKRLKVS